MKILGFEITKSKKPVEAEVEKEPTADWENGTMVHSFAVSYDGEKNLGEIGPVREYLLNYDYLRLRSWEAVLTSDIANTVISKITSWVIGSGLKLQSEPEARVLKSEGIEITSKNFSEEFNQLAEARFKVFSNSKRCDYAKQKTLNKLAFVAYKNAIVSGDVLVILRYENDYLTVQLIDGANIQSPLGNSQFMQSLAISGNRIVHGIELSKEGEHIAYYVRIAPLKWERVAAVGEKSGKKMAFLVYGREHRIDNCRGIPLLSTVLESLSSIERYKQATIGSAEERQKITYYIKHGQHSTGEDMRKENTVKALQSAHNADAKTEIPLDIQGKQLADKIAVTTNKTTFNMPIDSTLEQLDSKNELYFKDFFETNFNFFCSAVEVPPEVAKAMYNSNYSASRAAIKEWEHTVEVKRKDFADQFYQEIFNIWLDIEILKNKIQAPGYLAALLKENSMVIGAYQMARFTGPSVPQIDPVKEVQAIRMKLGESAKNIPLITVEQGTEELGGGDSSSNMNQFSQEMENAKKLKIVTEPVVEKPAPGKPAKT